MNSNVLIILLVILVVFLFMNKKKSEETEYFQAAKKSCPDYKLTNKFSNDECRTHAAEGYCKGNILNNCKYSCQPCVAEPLRKAWLNAKPPLPQTTAPVKKDVRTAVPARR